jgi:hypothetical protein
MNWKLRSGTSSRVYDLFEGDKLLLTVSINYKTSTFRAECRTDKRVFFINKTGFWKRKTVLQNEYGITIGKLFYEKWYSHIGKIEIDGELFNYTFHNNPLVELIFYKDDPGQPLVSCGLVANNGRINTKMRRSDVLEEGDNKYFLFALCWYLFLPISQENNPELLMSPAMAY